MKRQGFVVLVAGAALMAPPSASAAAGDRASGGGVAIGGDITFAFNARGTGTGTAATGRMTEVFRGPGGGVVHADVVCLSVAGNQADLQGTITRSSVEDQEVGDTLFFEVSDNGEPGAPADQFASFFSPGDIIPPNCGTPFPDTPIEHGNIQVRSGG